MKFFRDSLVAVLAGLLALVAMEGLFRLTRVRYNASLYTPEYERGYAYRPNAQGWQTVENDTYVRINSKGYHDRERSLSRPADTIRIAVLGSSEIAGENVALEYNFTTLLEKRLSQALASSGRKIEVLNTAIGGHSLPQQYLTMKNHVWDFDPQIVILPASAYSYVASTRDYRPDSVPGSPFFEVRDGVLRPDKLTRERAPLNQRAVDRRNRFADVMNRITLLGLANWAGVKAPSHIAAFRAFFRPAAPPPPNPHVRLTYVPDDPAVRKNWDVTEAILLDMKRECDRRNVEFWLGVLPLPWQIDPRPAVREQFMRGVGITSGDATAKHVQAFAEQVGAGFFDLTPPLSRYALEHHVALCGFYKTEYANGHPNELGQTLASKFAAEALLARSKVLSGVRDTAPARNARSAFVPLAAVRNTAR